MGELKKNIVCVESEISSVLKKQTQVIEQLENEFKEIIKRIERIEK